MLMGKIIIPAGVIVQGKSSIMNAIRHYGIAQLLPTNAVDKAESPSMSKSVPCINCTDTAVCCRDSFANNVTLYSDNRPERNRQQCPGQYICGSHHGTLRRRILSTIVQSIKTKPRKKLIKFDVDERTPTLQVDSHFTSVLFSNKYNRSFPDNYRTALPRSRMIEAQVNGP